jgi:hypothetical protein
VEHTILATAGAAVGLALAYWLVQAAVALAPAQLPRLDAVAIDLRVATFAFAAGLITLVIFGVAPALALWRARRRRESSPKAAATAARRGASASVSSSPARRRWRSCSSSARVSSAKRCFG